VNGRKSTPAQVAAAVEAVAALCLGKVGQIAWVDQVDATAFNDVDTIFLPTPKGVEGEYELLVALTLREIGKMCFTSSSHSQGVSSQDTFSIFEDARVKQRIKQDYPGAPLFFADAYQIASTALANAPAESPREAALRHVWARFHEALYALPQSLAAEREQAMAEYGHGIVEQLQDLVVEAVAMQNPLTVDSVQFGERANLLLNQRDQSQPSGGEGGQDDSQQAGGDQSQPSGGESGQDDSQQAGDDQSQPSGGEGGQNDSQHAGDDQSQPSGGEGGQNDSQQAGGDQSQPSGGESGQADGQQPRDFLADALSRLKGAVRSQQPSKEALEAAKLQSKDLADVAQDALDDAKELLMTVQQGSESELLDCDVASLVDAELQMLDSPSDEGHELPDATGKLVGVFLRALQDKRKRPVKLANSGSRIDARSAWRLKALGDTKVFRKRQKISGTSCAVSILVDRSGSMSRVISDVASVTHTMAHALMRVAGTKVAINAFPPTGEKSEVDCVQQFDESARQSRSRIASISASGNTPLGSALHAIRTDLLAQRMESRLVLIITDGDPDKGFETEMTKKMVAQLAADGVRIVGIGIGAEVGWIIPNCARIESASDLPEALERAFKNEMLASL
jgi:Mg-chelatase subunit ChlD